MLRLIRFFKDLERSIRYAKNGVLSARECKKGNLQEARMLLDEAFSVAQDGVPSRILAYDARLMVLEGRHEEAQDRLLECLESLPEDRDADAEYIYLYCKLQLSIYDARCSYPELEALRESAAILRLDQLRSRTNQLVLPLPSRQVFEGLLGYRRHIPTTDETQNSLTRPAKVNFNLEVDHS